MKVTKFAILSILQGVHGLFPGSQNKGLDGGALSVGTGWGYPLGCELTENITFPHPSDAGGNHSWDSNPGSNTGQSVRSTDLASLAYL